MVARVRFGWARRNTPREKFRKMFEQERDTILTLVQNCDAEIAMQQVLIDRIRGMEDSSRHWSVLMTVDHLRIVNQAMGEIIESLMKGELPDGEVRTADVKPDPDVTPEVIEEFEMGCDAFLEGTATLTGEGSGKLRHAHPWFGKMDADGWHALAAVHMRVHRIQIERIKQALA